MKFSLPPYWELFKASHAQIEQRVTEREGSYKDLSPEALYTSPEDLFTLLKHPLVGGTFADLGCGPGQGPLLYGTLYPERQAFGVEFEEARIEVGKKISQDYDLKNVLLLKDDLLSCSLPAADTYFLYFPTGPVLDRILNELYEQKRFFRLVAIESHGDLLPRLELENWLSLKAEVPLSSERHYPKAHIYERNFSERDSSLKPFLYSFRHSYLLLKEGGEFWLGESFGIEWCQERIFNLKMPPRTIKWEDVKDILKEEDLDSRELFVLKLRRIGEINLKTKNRAFKGFLRKIIKTPTFSLEISTGEKVEWEQIQSITFGNFLCYDHSSPSSFFLPVQPV